MASTQQRQTIQPVPPPFQPQQPPPYSNSNGGGGPFNGNNGSGSNSNGSFDSDVDVMPCRTIMKIGMIALGIILLILIIMAIVSKTLPTIYVVSGGSGSTRNNDGRALLDNQGISRTLQHQHQEQQQQQYQQVNNSNGNDEHDGFIDIDNEMGIREDHNQRPAAIRDDGSGDNVDGGVASSANADVIFNFGDNDTDEGENNDGNNNNNNNNNDEVNDNPESIASNDIYDEVYDRSRPAPIPPLPATSPSPPPPPPPHSSLHSESPKLGYLKSKSTRSKRLSKIIPK